MFAHNLPPNKFATESRRKRFRRKPKVARRPYLGGLGAPSISNQRPDKFPTPRNFAIAVMKLHALAWAGICRAHGLPVAHFLRVSRISAPTLWRWSKKQLAAHFGLDENSAYRWRKQGLIPSHLLTRIGTRRILFRPDVVAYLQAKFESER